MLYQVRRGLFTVIAKGPTDAVELYDGLSEQNPQVQASVFDMDGGPVNVERLREELSHDEEAK